MGSIDTNTISAGRAGLSRGAVFAVALLAAWAIWVSLTLMRGYVPLTLHNGDAAHLAALVLRMAEGEVPHRDFMTPVGIGSIWPIAALVQLGNGFGRAFLLAQAAFGALLLPALWWVGTTRFANIWLAAGFAAITLIVAMAVTHGGTEAEISISLHYNRWAWAISFVLLALILLPPMQDASRIEGLILGAGFAALALIKVTFFVGLAPAALLALALRRDRAIAAWALGTGCVIAGAITLGLGMGFWGAYLGDLIAVATSEVRARPGGPLLDTLIAPSHVGGTLVMAAAVVLFGRAGFRGERWILLAVWAGLTMITWQNYGNEAFWLPVVALVLAGRAATAPNGTAFWAAAGFAAALFVPVLANLATSPVRLATFAEPSAPFLRGVPGHEDFRISHAQLVPGPWAQPSPLTERREVETFWGETLPQCAQVATGMSMYFAMADEAAEAGFAGRPAMVAGVIQALWLFADFPRLEGAAPWYYSNLTGLEAAEIVIVPLCPQSPRFRAAVLAELEASGHVLTEVFRGEFGVVLEITR